MLLVGLTGGIGAGKSTLAALLAERGAVVVDADLLARRAVGSGTDGFHAVVGAFGEGVVGAGGDLDRAALASIVFNDPERLRELEAIVHPIVGRMVAEAVGSHRGTDAIVVIDTPLLAGVTEDGTSLTVVVTAPKGVRLARLRERGMDEADALARMAAQPSDEERLAIADVVVPNEGTPADLAAEADRLWTLLREREAAAGG